MRAPVSRVVERHRAVGSFEVVFRGIPQGVIDQITEFGHLVVTPAHEQGASLGDGLLESARYTGVVRFRRKSTRGEYDFMVRGCGLAWWMGTEDEGRGPAVIETAKTYAVADFDDVIRDLLPPGVTEGTLSSTALSPFSGKFQWVNRRQAIDYVCDSVGAVWRIRPNGELDAGAQAEVFGLDPAALIVRRQEDAGEDLHIRAFPGPTEADRDVEQYDTRVIVLGEVEDTDVVQGVAEIPSVDVPYKDLQGNKVSITRLINESSTESTNATARAEAALDENRIPEQSVILDTGNYDLRGTFTPGAFVYVWDPDTGMVDFDHEVVFRGQRLNPIRRRVMSMDWPITRDMGVYYRTVDGEWIDVTQWVDPVEGITSIEIGKSNRELVTGGLGTVGGGGSTPGPDTSIPNVPTLVTPFPQETTQNDSGEASTEITVQWLAPSTNTDSSPLTDLNHYEIGYRLAPAVANLWSLVEGTTWGGGLLTWDEPVAQPGAGEWEIRFAPADENTWVIHGLLPGRRYEFRIRAVDGADPPNASDWSAGHLEYALQDDLPPSTPAAAECVGSEIQVMVIHRCGKDTGGTFNLESDLAGFDVHASTEGAGFTPDLTATSATRLGRMTATKANLVGEIPAIATFPVTTTAELWVKVYAYDRVGNLSATPSEASTVTAKLIDSQWVARLTADKIDAGTISTEILLAGAIATSWSGQGMQMDTFGLSAYFADDTRGFDGMFFDLDIGNELVRMVGTLQSGDGNDRVVIQPDGTNASGASSLPEISFFAGPDKPAYINAYGVSGGTTGLGLNSGNSANTGTTRRQTTLRLQADTFQIFYNTAPGDSAGIGLNRGARIAGTSTIAQIEMWNSAGQRRAHLDVGAAALDAELLTTAGVRDGGFLWLRAGNTDSYFGKLTSAADSYLRFGSNGQVVLTDALRSSQLRMDTNGQIVLSADNNTFIRLNPGGNLEFYQNGTGYASLAALKSFVIDNPRDPDRLLVHGCTESPRAGVEYWDEVEIRDGRAVVELPGYFEAATRPEDRQVQLTPVGALCRVAYEPIRDGRFLVLSDAPDGTRVSWLVKAVRSDVEPFDPEPLRSDVAVGGRGPYRYILPKAS